jgi:hypothetical protein
VGLIRGPLCGALLAIAGAAAGQPAAQASHPSGFSHIGLSATRDDFYLSLGGEVRERFEYVRNADWDSANAPDGYLLQRYMLHADLHLGPRLRLFAHLKSGLEDGRAGGPRSTDEDRLAVHEAFLDLGLSRELTLRLGRQELVYGSSRLVSNRNGPNVRRGFDGARIILSEGKWRLDAFAVKPVKTEPGAFDDPPDHAVTFWGAYAVTPFPVFKQASVDLYYLGLDRKSSTYDQGTAREQRHSVGTRIWREQAPWDYNFELVYQWGRFGSAPIQAWTLASDTGFTLEAAAWRPRFGLKADVTSGDRDRSDPGLETFNALFPRGSYFGEAALIGPANHVDLHPSIELHARPWLTISPGWIFFWRQSRDDGLYGASGAVERSGQGAHARYVGSQATLTLTARIGRHTTLVTDFESFLTGPFLRESGPADNLGFLASWVSFSF